MVLWGGEWYDWRVNIYNPVVTSTNWDDIGSGV